MIELHFRGNPWRNWNVFSKKNYGTRQFDSVKHCNEIIENHVAWYGEKSRCDFKVVTA